MPLAAEKAGRKIAVEVKSFLGASQLTELQKALGQYLMYEFVLERVDPERRLFLAVPGDVFERVFRSPDIVAFLGAYHVRTITYSPELEEIVQWSE